jgi:hypothetical protein
MRVVEHQPIKTDLLDRPHEALEVDRFLDVAVVP